MAVVQAGRLANEALIFAASFRASNPDFNGSLVFAEPQAGPLWNRDPSLRDPDLRALLTEEFGASIVPFESEAFGSDYPNGNKIEALKVVPADQPFVFFDTDTVFTGALSSVPFDFDQPTASMRRENTWPKLSLYGPGYSETWKSLYDRFGLDFESSLDRSFPDEYWERYLYFNAGWFFFRCPQAFHARYRDYATSIRTDPPPELICQELYPWLDQIALPLVVHALGGGRNTIPAGLLDGSVSCHYRVLSLLYAREPDVVVETLEAVTAPNKVKKVLKGWEAAKRLIYQGRGEKARALFDQKSLPPREQAIRNRLRREKLWMR